LEESEVMQKRLWIGKQRDDFTANQGFILMPSPWTIRVQDIVDLEIREYVCEHLVLSVMDSLEGAQKYRYADWLD